MDRTKIQEYDLCELREALRRAYDYYCASGYRQTEARLKTIYDKLETQLRLQENK